MATDAAERWTGVLQVLWGAFVALWVTRHFFLLPENQFIFNDDEIGYLLRQIEFQDCLAAGYWSPQWCTDFRSGLGSPYFSFYQPGWFYFTSLFAWCPNLVWQVGLSLVVISLIGYLAIATLVAPRFGMAAGGTAGTFFLVSQYAASNLYLRGDFSEYAAMMLVAAWFWALDRTWNRVESRWWFPLSWVTGALVYMHPCVSLQVAIVGGGVITTLFLWERDRHKLLVTAVSLFVGGLLATAQWLTVFGEMQLVQFKETLVGHFFYGGHFLTIRDIFYAPSNATTATVVKFGPVPTVALAFACIVALARWKTFNPSQRFVVIVGAMSTGIALFFITSWSRWIWDNVSLMANIQFPWRFLALLSTGSAILISVVRQPFSKRMWLGVNGLLLLALLYSRSQSPEIKTMPFERPESVRHIADHYFAPDLSDEWSPRGANAFSTGEFFHRNYVGPRELVVEASQGLQVRGSQLSTGRIECSLQTTAAVSLTLRHYFYPVGWRATLNGEPMVLAANADGLMRLALPANRDGTLIVQFHTTPLRKIGLTISLLTAGALLAVMVRARRMSRLFAIVH